MMNLNSLRIALTFAGCFLGAGFVSGQELWQFFASFGLKGLFGLVLSMSLLFVFGVLLMRLANNSGFCESDKLIIRKNNKILRAFVGVATVFFLFGIAVIMSSGVGALFEQQWGIHGSIASSVFAVLVFILALGGHERLVNVFSVTVPVLVVFTVAIGILAYIRFPYSNAESFSQLQNETNPLLGSWWVSALTFVSYNLFSSVEIIAPFGNAVNNKRRTVLGIALGSGFLLLIALCIFLSMYLCPESVAKDLPMLYVASVISPVLASFYAVLLILGMLGTALSSLVGAIHFLCEKYIWMKNNKIAVVAVMSSLMFVCGLVGFGELIGTVYPICGYFGIAALVLMIEHMVHIKIKGKNNDRI